MPPPPEGSRDSRDLLTYLVGIYGNREQFLEEYRSLLASRLLSRHGFEASAAGWLSAIVGITVRHSAPAALCPGGARHPDPRASQDAFRGRAHDALLRGHAERHLRLEATGDGAAVPFGLVRHPRHLARVLAHAPAGRCASACFDTMLQPASQPAMGERGWLHAGGRQAAGRRGDGRPVVHRGVREL